MSKFTTVIAICLLTWTSLLVTKTLQIQHSCQPMIHWGGELPTKCQVAIKNSFNSAQIKQLSPQKLTQTEPIISIPKLQEKSQIIQNTDKSQPNNVADNSHTLEIADNSTQTESETKLDRVINSIQENPDVAGGVAGGVAAAGLAALSSIAPPVAIAVGFVIWLATRTILK
ncbi:conserved hypothetical protein [Hyella patelloides LEGE 07179]|uniref:Uncharacterized protein n=1 Tax=Hyella patelloides LEGE 07179 TaxID=945734 RepID=A0A563VYV1_9CYAN|nr:hypothetical protein [Hyella patelloides]VEP16634.1 conserved hypothetical protein [Hyella patelloides LEGE 07179]